MYNFSRELSAYLTDTKAKQTHFAKRAGFPKSKLSRVLSDSIWVDRDSLDAIVEAVPAAQHEWRTRLVAAYIKDLVSPGAMLQLKGKSKDDLYRGLDFSRMTPKGRAALKALISSDQWPYIEDILILLATALGVLK